MTDESQIPALTLSRLSTVDGYWRMDTDPVEAYDRDVMALEAMGYLESKSWDWTDRVITQWFLTKAGKEKLEAMRKRAEENFARAMEAAKKV